MYYPAQEGDISIHPGSRGPIRDRDSYMRNFNTMNRELIKKASKRKRRRSKSKKRHGIQDSDVFRFVETSSRWPLVPTRWRKGDTTPRDRSPRARRDLIKDAKELNSIVQNLKQRIASIPLRNRPVPNTVDPYILGVELKLRLAAKAPIIEENTGKAGKVWVRVVSTAQRVVPIYHVNSRSDCRINFRMRINRMQGTIKRLLDR